LGYGRDSDAQSGSVLEGDAVGDFEVDALLRLDVLGKSTVGMVCCVTWKMSAGIIHEV
jgi:hypothetical protein